MKRLLTNPNSKKLNKISAAVLLGILSGISTVSYAQASTDEASNDEKDIETITVTGMRGSLLKSLNQKRFSNKVSDIITAEDIGKFPEANIAEAMQRIPGVTLNRNDRGEGTAINLRGLGPEFASTEVNGMVAGGSNGQRGFSFEIFPAELFSTVEISKSITADQFEGGIAGSVSLKTPDPLSFGETVFNVSLQSTYSENAESNTPKATLVFNKTWNDTFGINASVVYSEVDLQSQAVLGDSHSILSSVWKGPAVGQPGGATQEQLDALIPRIESFEHITESRETLGISLAAQWRPSDDLEVLLRVLKGTLEGDRRRTVLDAPSESNITAINNAVVENGVITQATLTGVQQRVGARQSLDDEDVSQLVLSADWTISETLTFSPYIGSFKREKTDSNDLFSFRHGWRNDNTGFDNHDVSYIMRDDYLEWSTPGTDYASNPEEFALNVLIRRPIEREDSNVTAKLDFQYDNLDMLTVDFGVHLSGVELSQKASRVNLQASQCIGGADRSSCDNSNPSPTGRLVNRLTDLPTLADVFNPLENFNVDSASFAPSTLIGGDPSKIISTFYNTDGSSAIDGTYLFARPEFGLSNTYRVEEDTVSLYAQANIEVSDELFISTGLRYVQTDQTIHTQSNDTGGRAVEDFSPITLKSDYKEVLPNINIRYELTEDIVLRGAYFRSLTRPNLGQLAGAEAFSGVDSGGGTGSRGNPDLIPLTADNYDLGFEWYFTEEAIVSVNLFYKDLDGFIDSASTTEIREFPRQSDGVIVQGPIIFTQPTNGVAATINGLELAYQSRLGIISESLEDFGVLINYTSISSGAQYSNEGDVRNSGLPGLSETSYNFALLYDVTDFDARLSYTWRDEYLSIFAGTAGVPEWQGEFGQLDFSANYNVTDKLQLQLQAWNLLGEQQVTKSVNNTPYALRQIDTRIGFGLRYSF